jgi:hypothetical protein
MMQPVYYKYIMEETGSPVKDRLKADWRESIGQIHAKRSLIWEPVPGIPVGIEPELAAGAESNGRSEVI